MLIDFSRAPTERERKDLRDRLARLETMRTSVTKATDSLAELVTKSSFTEVLVRKDFVYQVDAPPGDWSDRKLPPRELRPPAAQLVSPRGASLRLFLTALFEAQARGRPGTHPANPRPLKAAGTGKSWLDLLASDARASMSGRTFMNVPDKKLRQLRNTLDRLVSADLVALPNANLKGMKRYDDFRLQHEAGTRRNGPNINYTLPRSTDTDVFRLPIELFTKGWIHVLEDTELLFVLMLAYYAARTPPDGGMRIDSETRLLHHGISRDGYEAHFMLSWLDLAYVKPDVLRRDDGRVEGFGEGAKPLPHALRLLPEGFGEDGMPRLMKEIEYQLSRN
jgi:hypothetical protein